MLGRLSFGTHTPRRLKGVMQISVNGHPLEVPFQALQGYFITRVAGSFPFQTARVRGQEPSLYMYPPCSSCPCSPQGGWGRGTGYSHPTMLMLVSPGSAAFCRPASIVARGRRTSRSRQCSPSQHSWTLLSAGDSGSLQRRGFRRRLQLAFMQLIDHRRVLCTTQRGCPFLAGVLEGIRIPISRLSAHFFPMFRTFED